MRAVCPGRGMLQRIGHSLPCQFTFPARLFRYHRVRVSPWIFWYQRRSVLAMPCKLSVHRWQRPASLHRERSIPRPEHQLLGLLLRQRLPGHKQRLLHPLPGQRLVLDWCPQPVPSQHLGACPVQLHQKLHVQPWLHGTKRNSMQPMQQWDIQSAGGERKLFGLPDQELLPPRVRNTHLMRCGV